MPGIYHELLRAKASGEKKFAVLIDPDKLQHLDRILELSTNTRVDYFFIGGSLLVRDGLDECLQRIQESCGIPTVLFPGNHFQLNHRADALLFLSLISGRNPDLLIGKHVAVAPLLKDSSLEVIPTGYILIDGGVATTVGYMSNTQPIPAGKIDIAVCTALAGELLGLQMLYLEAGSGASHPVREETIRAVSREISVPLIVGGGIRDSKSAGSSARAGADMIVVGNAIENDPELIVPLAQAVHNQDGIL